MLIHRAVSAVIGLCLLPWTAGAEPVQVQLRWEYVNMASHIEVYEPKPKPRQRVWKMRTVKEWSRVPVAERIANDKVSIEPGAAKRIVLVMRNDSDQPIRFTAAPHSAHPPGGAKPRFRFKCLCVHKTFEIGPHQIWFRVVELRTAPATIDQEITLTHVVTGE